MREAGSDQPLSVVPPEARLVRAPAAALVVTVLPDGALTVAQRMQKMARERSEVGFLEKSYLLTQSSDRAARSRGPDCVKKAGT